MSSLEDTKVEDIVIKRRYAHGIISYSKHTVSRMTKTQIIIIVNNIFGKEYELRYRKRDGGLIGSHGSSGVHEFICIPTPKLYQLIKEQKISNIKAKLNTIDFNKIDNSLAIEVWKLLNDAFSNSINQKNSRKL